MFTGRVLRLILFGFIVAFSTTIGMLIGYEPVLIIAGLLTSAAILAILLVRRLR